MQIPGRNILGTYIFSRYCPITAETHGTKPYGSWRNIRTKYVPFRTDAALVTGRIQDPTVKLRDSWGFRSRELAVISLEGSRSALIGQTGRQEKLVRRLWLCGNFMLERNLSYQETFSV